MKSLAREVIVTILLALLIFAVMQATFQSFKVEGESMEPNIHDGQYLLVNKAVYFFRPPRRGEVVVFHLSSNPHSNYVKRIIALPGEMVWAEKGRIYIQGEDDKVFFLEESYLEGHPLYSFGPYQVEPGKYFVLGDNRDHSSDSRLWGAISQKEIIGKAWLRYWPPGEWGLLPAYSFPKGDA